MTRRTSRGPTLAGSIRRATVGVAAASVLVVFLVFLTFWVFFTISQTTQELSTRVSAVAKGLSGSGRLATDTGIRQRLFRVEAGLIGANLYITDASGDVLASSAGTAAHVRLPVNGTAGARGVQAGVRGVPGLGSAVVVAAAVADVGGYPTAAWLVALEPLREINRSRGWVVLVLVGCALLALVGAWFAGGALARRIAAPIVRLRDGTRAVAEGDWGHQVTVEGAEEVAALASSFNSMSARVADAYRAQRDFVGDVSHELRTPITSIQGFSGAMLDGTVTVPEDQRRYLGVIHDEAQRLGELTNSLLALSELESGSAVVGLAPVDTEGLAQALRARYEHRAMQRRIDLRVESLSGTPLGDGDRLLQALSTLVDNAISYTPDGGSVLVSSAPSDSAHWAVAVDDTGPGIPPDRREEVFRRFARLDPSRSKVSGGAGLGLAICRRSVELMGGTVRAQDGALGGARFVIELRRA